MPYRIELAQQWSEPFHLEIELRGQGGASIPGGLDGVEHRLVACGRGKDYGLYVSLRSELASTTGGQITTPDPNIIVIDFPFDRFRSLSCCVGGTLHCELSADRAGFSPLIATILISFEGCC